MLEHHNQWHASHYVACLCVGTKAAQNGTLFQVSHRYLMYYMQDCSQKLKRKKQKFTRLVDKTAQWSLCKAGQATSVQVGHALQSVLTFQIRISSLNRVYISICVYLSSHLSQHLYVFASRYITFFFYYSAIAHCYPLF